MFGVRFCLSCSPSTTQPREAIPRAHAMTRQQSRERHSNLTSGRCARASAPKTPQGLEAESAKLVQKLGLRNAAYKNSICASNGVLDIETSPTLLGLGVYLECPLGRVALTFWKPKGIHTFWTVVTG